MDHFNFLAKLDEEIECINYKISKLQSKKQLLKYAKSLVNATSSTNVKITDVNTNDIDKKSEIVLMPTDSTIKDDDTLCQLIKSQELSNQEFINFSASINSSAGTSANTNKDENEVIEKNMLETFILNDESDSMRLWNLMNERRNALQQN